MRPFLTLALRAAALSLTLAGAAICAMPACSIISAEADCKSACDNLSMCGLLSAGNCTAYCAGLATGATVAGCADKFDAQNSCGKDHPDCTEAATSCTQQVQDFTDCMNAYCKDHPDGQGCPGGSGADGG